MKEELKAMRRHVDDIRYWCKPGWEVDNMSESDVIRSCQDSAMHALQLIDKLIESPLAFLYEPEVGELSEELIYEACKEYMRVMHPAWNPDKPLFKAGQPNWKLYADGIRAVLAFAAAKQHYIATIKRIAEGKP